MKFLDLSFCVSKTWGEVEIEQDQGWSIQVCTGMYQVQVGQLGTEAHSNISIGRSHVLLSPDPLLHAKLEAIQTFVIFFSLLVLGIELRVSCMISMLSTTEIYPIAQILSFLET